MDWVCGEKLADPKIIEEIEMIIGYQYPSEYKTVVLQNDGGSPEWMIFDTSKTKERVFNNLISFEDGTLDGALEYVLSSGKKQWAFSGLKWRYVPFGDDPFGNMLCFDRENDHVVFFDHETRKIEEVADSFTEFIDSLYDDGFEPFGNLEDLIP